MACKVKTHKKSRFLLFRLFWKGDRFWEGTKLVDTPDNRKLAEAKATIISQEMKRRNLRLSPTLPGRQ